jgi:hypothetical protein
MGCCSVTPKPVKQPRGGESPVKAPHHNPEDGAIRDHNSIDIVVVVEADANQRNNSSGRNSFLSAKDGDQVPMPSLLKLY